MKSLAIFPVKTRVRLSETQRTKTSFVFESDMLGQCDCDCSSDCACTPGNSPVPSGQFQLKFRDREKILSLIETGKFRRIVLDAPAGYGKSYLLRESKNRLEKKGWLCIVVTLPFDDERVKSIGEIRSEIITGLEAEFSNDVPDPDDLLMGEFRNVKKFALMFDSIEADDNGKIVAWIREKIAEPLRRSGRKDYQIILAGRHVQRDQNPYEWEKWKGRLQNFPNDENPIEPLRQEVLQAINVSNIQEILEDVLDFSGVPTLEDLHRVAEGIAWLSAGHPGIVEKLVDEWRANKYGQDFSPATSQDRLKSVFKSRILGCVEELLNGFSDKKIQLLRVVSVFRQMDHNLLKNLFDRQLLDGDYQLVWTKVIALKLFDKPKSHAYWKDGVMRQVIARKLEILENTEYCRLHGIALEIWEEQLLKLAKNHHDVFSHREQVVNGIRNILYHAINSGLTEEDMVSRLCGDLLAVRKDFWNNLDDLVKLYEDADFSENDLHEDSDWIDYLEIRHKPRPSQKDIKTQLRHLLSINRSTDTKNDVIQDGGSNKMEIKIESKLLDALARALDFLRQNAQNVLIERWEKRNRGTTETPPIFNYTSVDDVKKSLSSIAVVSQSFSNPEGITVVINEQHIESLITTMENAQRSKDRYTQELANPLPTNERVQVQHQIDTYQQTLDKAASELADIFAYLYHPQ